MHRLPIVLILACSTVIIGQEESNKKQRKVYRTQSGAIIEAPRPLFNQPQKKKKTKIDKETSQMLVRTKEVTTT